MHLKRILRDFLAYDIKKQQSTDRKRLFIDYFFKNERRTLFYGDLYDASVLLN